MRLVELVPNIPQELAWGSETRPVKLPGGSGCLYALADGRTLHLPNRNAESLASFSLKPGETFVVCLHQKANDWPYYVLWLSTETEKARARQEDPDIHEQLRESLKIVARGERPKAPNLQPQLAATGTDGPVPQRKPAIAAVAAGKTNRPGPIPYNVAFREIVQLVAHELKESGEQWSDQARQDAVSTLFISAGKAGWLGVWERGEAA